MSDDSFTSGLAAAMLVEEGKEDVAKELLEEALVCIIERDNKLAVGSGVAGEANEILNQIQGKTYSSTKHRALELMLIDTPLSDDEKEKFFNRYGQQSVKRVMFSQKAPGRAVLAEIGDDIGAVVSQAPADFVNSLRSTWRRIGDAFEEYMDSSIGDKLKKIYDPLLSVAGGIGEFTKGVARGLVYSALGATGIRKANEFTSNENMEEKDISVLEGLPAIVIPAVSMYLAVGGGISIAILASLPDGAFSGEIAPYFAVLYSYLFAPLGYEGLRIGVKKYQGRVDEMKSFNASLEAPQVRVEPNLDNEIPVYTDVDGEEERVYIGAGNTPIPLTRKIPQ